MQRGRRELATTQLTSPEAYWGTSPRPPGNPATAVVFRKLYYAEDPVEHALVPELRLRRAEHVSEARSVARARQPARRLPLPGWPALSVPDHRYNVIQAPTQPGGTVVGGGTPRCPTKVVRWCFPLVQRTPNTPRATSPAELRVSPGLPARYPQLNGHKIQNKGVTPVPMS